MTENTSGTEPTAVVPPRPLIIARWLWIISTLVGVVHSVVQVADRNALLARIEDVAPQLSQQDLDTAANGQVMFALLVSVLTFAVYLLFANRMVQGRNWARIVLTVLGGLNALGAVVTLSAVGVLGLAAVRELTGIVLQPTDLMFGAVTVVLAAAALILMFQPESNRFFREPPKRTQLDSR